MDQVEFKLSYPAGELVGEGLVMILKAVTRLGVLRGEELRLAWRKASVVAVMRPNHLNLIEVNPMVLFRLALCHTARRYKDKRHDKYDATQNTIPLRASCIDAFRNRPSATPVTLHIGIARATIALQSFQPCLALHFREARPSELR